MRLGSSTLVNLHPTTYARPCLPALVQTGPPSSRTRAQSPAGHYPAFGMASLDMHAAGPHSIRQSRPQHLCGGVWCPKQLLPCPRLPTGNASVLRMTMADAVVLRNTCTHTYTHGRRPCAMEKPPGMRS
jgi:hypothetical protein